MTPTELLTEAFGRIVAGGRDVVDGLDEDQLARQPAPGANTIAWLVWHVARVQDDHVADVAGVEQVWTGQGFHERFGLPLDVAETGFGFSTEQMESVRASGELLASYLAAVHEQTIRYVEGLAADDLDRVVDERWDPPVTLGVRLVSVINDNLQHLGQAAYVRGLPAGQP